MARDWRSDAVIDEHQIAALREETRRAAGRTRRVRGWVAAVIVTAVSVLLAMGCAEAISTHPLVVALYGSPERAGDARPGSAKELCRVLRLSRGLGVLKRPVIVEVERGARHETLIRLRKITARIIGAGGREASVIMAWARFDTAGRLQQFGPRGRVTPSDARHERALESAACAGLADLFHRRDLPGEFEIDVRRTSKGYTMVLSDVPYSPGAFSVVEISRQFRVLGGHGGM
jgi:hypothetical protein